jgi:hypothetical protein
MEQSADASTSQISGGTERGRKWGINAFPEYVLRFCRVTTVSDFSSSELTDGEHAMRILAEDDFVLGSRMEWLAATSPQQAQRGLTTQEHMLCPREICHRTSIHHPLLMGRGSSAMWSLWNYTPP